jgi:hypothetical protein
VLPIKEKAPMAQIQFKGKPFVQNHHLSVKYHELIPNPTFAIRGL